MIIGRPNPLSQDEYDFGLDLDNTVEFFDDGKPNEKVVAIEQRGYPIRSSEVNDGELVTEVVIPEGQHTVIFGFRALNPMDSRWYHGGLDDEERYVTPFTYDIESEEFKKVCERLLHLKDIQDLSQFIRSLNEELQTTIASNMDREDAQSLSGILRAGKAACASKSVVAGSLIKTINPEIRVESILGYYGKTNNQVDLPYGHEWLRIKLGPQIALYDPFYNQLFVTNVTNEPRSLAHFDNLTISAYPFGRLHEQIGIRAAGGIHLAKSYGQGKEFIVDDDIALDAQIEGQLGASIQVTGGILTLKNGCIESEITNNGPRLLYPLSYLEKEDK